MTKMPRVTHRELIKALKRAGFVEGRQRGSHLYLWREYDKVRVIVPVHQGRDMRTGTLRSILRDAKISPDDFRKLLKKKR